MITLTIEIEDDRISKVNVKCSSKLDNKNQNELNTAQGLSAAMKKFLVENTTGYFKNETPN